LQVCEKSLEGDKVTGTYVQHYEIQYYLHRTYAQSHKHRTINTELYAQSHEYKNVSDEAPDRASSQV